MDTSHRWSEFLTAYGPVIVAWTTFSMLLALPEWGIESAFLQAFFLISWSYWGHRWAHTVSATYPWSLLNPHVSIHHDHVISVPRWVNLVLETLVNFMGFFFFWILQWATGIHLLSTSMILGAAFLYIAIHILDYSLIGRPEHALHHTQTFCNYDPEFMDTLFHTRCDNGSPYKNMTHEILHAFGAFVAALSLKVSFNLD